MRIGILLFLAVCLSSCGGSKLFSKKFLGTYDGTQEAYEVNISGDVIVIPEEQYQLVLDYDKFWLSSSRQTLKANYTMDAETNMYYTLLVKLENGLSEEWQLWKKGKQLIRKEVAPRPQVIFVKTGKKQKELKGISEESIKEKKVKESKSDKKGKPSKEKTSKEKSEKVVKEKKVKEPKSEKKKK